MPWFFGNGYNRVVPNIIVIAPILVLIALSNIMGTQYLLPIGRQKEYTLSVVTGCIVNFLMNLILIPKFYSIGAAIATVIAEASVTGVQIFCTRKDFCFWKIANNNKQYVISSLVMFIIIYTLSPKLQSSIINTFLCIIIGGGIYLGTLLIIKDETIIEAIEKIKTRIGK